VRVEPIILAMVSAMRLLNDCGPEEVNPDTAVRGLENMAYELMQLGPEERAELIDTLNRLADEADPGDAWFLRSVPFYVGMVENPPE
jgi:hypothetical protein